MSEATMNPPVTRIYSVVLGVGIACAVSIVLVYESTRPIIIKNQLDLRERAILDVLPGASTSCAYRLDALPGKFTKAPVDAQQDAVVFAGYDDAGNLIGVAVATEGMGYQDVIRVLYGYSFAQQAVIGMRVLSSRETPGLGDRIENDADFLRNFTQLDVRLAHQENRLAHPITFVKPGHKSDAWQIDGITGATISSRAVAEMVSASTARWVPRVHSRQADFEIRMEEGS